MKKENGNSDEHTSTTRSRVRRRPREYYIPSSQARNICYYRQKESPEAPALGVESFDYGIITVLHLTGLAYPDVQIEAVQVDGNFPLQVAVQNAEDFFSRAEFPVRIGYGASFCLLLRAPAATDAVQRFCYSQKPASVWVSTRSGILVFDAEV